jgi:hypothetical protein
VSAQTSPFLTRANDPDAPPHPPHAAFSGIHFPPDPPLRLQPNYRPPFSMGTGIYGAPKPPFVSEDETPYVHAPACLACDPCTTRPDSFVLLTHLTRPPRAHTRPLILYTSAQTVARASVCYSPIDGPLCATCRHGGFSSSPGAASTASDRCRWRAESREGSRFPAGHIAAMCL